MVIPNKFGTAGEAPLVNLGIAEISTGKARTDLFLGLVYQGYASGASVEPRLDVAASAAGIISNIPFYSDIVVYDSAVNDPLTFRKHFDIDFEIPQTVVGQMIIQVPLVVVSNPAAGTGRAWVELDVQKIDKDDNMTSIASGATRSVVVESDTTSGAVLAWETDFPRTLFKRDEKMRIRVTMNSSPTAFTTNAFSFIGCDPQGRTWPKTLSDGTKVATTKFVVQTPFKINL